MIPQDFSIVFFFFEGGKRGVLICNSQCFQELYLETRHETSMDYTWPFCPRM